MCIELECPQRENIVNECHRYVIKILDIFA